VGDDLGREVDVAYEAGIADLDFGDIPLVEKQDP
jgi:hypothetical protein